jgi:hypothetical protein
VSEREIAGSELCSYFHTGGGTGLPKIAAHTHLNESYVACMLSLMQPGPNVVLCGLPLFHVNGAMATGLAAFHAGWEVVMLTPQGYRGAGVLPNFWKLVERFRANSFSAVPTILATLAIGVCGPNVFPGYLRAKDNEGAWLAPGWFNTGDLGYLDQNGFLRLTGRAKDLIIRGGHNIDPAMIEEALAKPPAVALAAAVGQPDEHAGELPVAYVTLKPDCAAPAEALLDKARELVPERADVPVRIEVLQHMPLTPIGKIAKTELRMLPEQVDVLLVRSHRQFSDGRAAVGKQGLSRDEPRRLREEEGHRCGDLFGLAEAAHRHGCQEAPFGFTAGRRILPEQRRLGRAGRDAVHGDPGARQFERPGTGKAHHGALGCRVGRALGHPQHDQAGHVDDPAPPAFAHPRQQSLHDLHRRAQVEPEAVLEVGQIDVADPGQADKAHVVDHAIDGMFTAQGVEGRARLPARRRDRRCAGCPESRGRRPCAPVRSRGGLARPAARTGRGRCLWWRLSPDKYVFSCCSFCRLIPRANAGGCCTGPPVEIRGP